jgi:hypothetical protein
MEKMAALVQKKLDKDKVPVFEFLRLRPGSSRVHEDTVQPFVSLTEIEWDRVRKSDNPRAALKNELKSIGYRLRKFNYLKQKPSDPDFKDAEPGVRLRVKDTLPEWLIDNSATPQQWLALTRHQDFEKGKGLPPDPNRRIRIRDKWLEAGDEIEFFPPGSYPDMAPGALAIREGYVELGSSFHHARIYKCTKRLQSGARTFYAMLRVYQADIRSFAGQRTDLFTVSLPLSSISVRASEKRLRDALVANEAEYVGWILSGDELQLDMTSQKTGKSGAIVSQFPEASVQWVVQGLSQPTKLALVPRLLASEGLDENASPEAQTVLAKTGWVVSIDVLFGKCHPTIIRRDILGRPRTVSAAHLPVTWSVGEPPGALALPAPQLRVEPWSAESVALFDEDSDSE